MEERLFPIPREEIIFRNLDKYSLPQYVKIRIEKILDGEISESSLRCCSSGCGICELVIFECLQDVKKELEAK
jgi:hypothetical protein